MSKDLYYPPLDIINLIVDLIHDDREALKACCLISKSWVPSTQKFLFDEIRFTDNSKFEKWKLLFPNPAKSPAHHAHFLLVGCMNVSTEEFSWIQSFTNITQLEVWDCMWPDRRWKTSYEPFDTLSSINSLCMGYDRQPQQFSELICSFPLLKDLYILNVSNSEVFTNSNLNINQCFTLPPLTGTLVLRGELEGISHQVLNLPFVPGFQEIVWKTAIFQQKKEIPGLVTALVNRCSDTLRHIGFDISGCKSCPFGPCD